MTGKTHISIGLMSSAAVLSVNHSSTGGLLVGLALGTVGALMPDIDTGKSTISYRIRQITTYGIVALLAVYVLMSNFSPQVEKINLFLKGIGVYKIFDRMPHNSEFLNTGLAILIVCIIFSKFTKHRSFTHSILGLFIFTLGFYLIVGNAALYFAVGFVSHMLADTLTNSGIGVFYPIKTKIALKLVHTGSMIDHFIGGAAFVLFIVVMTKNL
ncbi:metal-dependent hydrolase [Clostridium felsineum]|uniref:Uncharacterized protein n=1 Tax=Clostridium felsineum TaxID=36839 RepID=A0A1S8L1G7_9CLOT|nr:metal-dependent hydrolase [Clostridium felsineum]MCR3759735.1 metal-dependent hydrolase [Clostridium felsineum]URZ01234.1 hypothetical protein CLAUR_012230 [Clostridium felsineum]URZ06012.1 hypothetical protein CLROS_013440 [Clostridium felsineum]URZ11049.1 hypothetical protein CROST_017650 [Clostridium felsineum]URZ15678.1 hypothetical protein CLFE_017240 [Clostridium felsineum DSM 794]